MYSDTVNSVPLIDNPATSSHTSYVFDGTKFVASHASHILACFVPAVMSDGADNIPSRDDCETVIVLAMSVVFSVSLEIPSVDVMMRYLLVTSKVHQLATVQLSTVLCVSVLAITIVFATISLRYS